jgi:DNA-binding Lrp family transcriptional regulator/transposase-like protein
MTHEERRARRDQIAAEILKGQRSIREIAQMFGLTQTMIYTVRRDMPEYNMVTRRNDDALLALAQQVAAGTPLTVVAADAEVSIKRLRQACLRIGITPRVGRPRGQDGEWMPRRYTRVDWAQPDRHIAETLGTTRQAVHAMRQKLERLGRIDRRPRRIGHRTEVGAPAKPIPPFEWMFAALDRLPEPERAVMLQRQSRALTPQDGTTANPTLQLTIDEALKLLRLLPTDRRGIAVVWLFPLIRRPLPSADAKRLLTIVPAKERADLRVLIPALA